MTAHCSWHAHKGAHQLRRLDVKLDSCDAAALGVLIVAAGLRQRGRTVRLIVSHRIVRCGTLREFHASPFVHNRQGSERTCWCCHLASRPHVGKLHLAVVAQLHTCTTFRISDMQSNVQHNRVVWPHMGHMLHESVLEHASEISCSSKVSAYRAGDAAVVAAVALGGLAHGLGNGGDWRQLQTQVLLLQICIRNTLQNSTKVFSQGRRPFHLGVTAAGAPQLQHVNIHSLQPRRCSWHGSMKECHEPRQE